MNTYTEPYLTYPTNLGHTDNKPALVRTYSEGKPGAAQAISALTPGLFKVATEFRALYGSTEEATLANLLGWISFAASGNFQTRRHNGNTMPLSLAIFFLGGPVSGKSDAYTRFKRPIFATMRKWTKPWAFADTTQSSILRSVRQGMKWGQQSRDEGRSYFKSALSRSFDTKSNLYEGEPPEYSRVDDIKEDSVNNTPESIAFTVLMNSQAHYFHEWRAKYLDEALASGDLYRVLILESKCTADSGAGGKQPEVALLQYDKRMSELIENGCRNLETLQPHQLEVLEVSAEAAQALHEATEQYTRRACNCMRPEDAKVLAIRLSANTRRIAGCMHTYEGYCGDISADTMARACIVAMYCLGCWLDAVLPYQPPPPPPQAQIDANTLERELKRHGCFSVRESDVLATSSNFGWKRTRMKEAICAMCGSGRAFLIPRINNGRREIMLELQFSYLRPFAHI